MWTVVYIARTKDMADKLQKILEDDGMLVKVRPICKSTDGSDTSYEVLVPESEVEQAHGLIIDIQ